MRGAASIQASPETVCNAPTRRGVNASWWLGSIGLARLVAAQISEHVERGKPTVRERCDHLLRWGAGGDFRVSHSRAMSSAGVTFQPNVITKTIQRQTVTLFGQVPRGMLQQLLRD